MERLGLGDSGADADRRTRSGVVCQFLHASVVVEPSSQVDQEDSVESLGLAIRS
jgi:hypothetical protein